MSSFEEMRCIRRQLACRAPADVDTKPRTNNSGLQGFNKRIGMDNDSKYVTCSSPALHESSLSDSYMLDRQILTNLAIPMLPYHVHVS